MAVTFNGADLTVRFKEQSTNGAELQYQLEYQCLTGSITHYVDATQQQSTDPDGMRVYKDTLTYAENQSAGLTRSPRVRMRTQSASGQWSDWRTVDAQNPIPVLPEAPSVVSTLTGVEVTLKTPADADLEGFVVWVHTDTQVPLDATTERYRGNANSFSLQLADDRTYYMRVAPYDAFGLDLASAWQSITIKRGDLNSAVGGTDVVKNFAAGQAAIDKALGQAQSDVGKVKLDLAQETIRLDGDVADVRQAVSDASTAAANASAQAAQVRTDLVPSIADAKKAGTDAAAVASKASTDLDAEITRAKGAEGTITTKVETAQHTADGAVTAISTETTQRVDGDKLLSQRIDTVESTANTDKGSLNTRITNEVATLVSADEAIGRRVDSVVTQANTDRSTAAAAVRDETTARTTAVDAVAKRTSDLETNYTSVRNDLGDWNQDRANEINEANARIGREETARSTADGALGQRIDTVTATANTDRTNNDAAIRDERTARSTAVAALASRTDSIEASSATGAGYLNLNPNFTKWDDGLTAPNGWINWNADGSIARIPSGQPTGGYAVRTNGNATGNYGFAQMDSGGPVFQNGWYILEADVELHSGSWLGSGLSIQGQANLDFARDPDTFQAGANNTYIGRRKFSKLVKLEVQGMRNWHAMVNWDGYGASQKSMTWYRAAVRPATQGEIDGRQGKIDAAAADARVAREETARTTAVDAVGSRIQKVEADYVTSGAAANIAQAKVNDEATARADGDSGLSNRIGTVEASSRGAGNLIPNTDFATLSGWSITHNGMAMNPLVTQTGDYWDPRGETVLYLTRGGVADASTFTEVQSAPFAITPNSYIQFYAMTSSHRSRAWTSVFFRDENGNDAGYAGENYASRNDNGGPDLSGWEQTGKKSVQVPANARFAVFVWRIYEYGIQGANPVGWFFHPYVGEARANQTEWNPYSVGSAKRLINDANARISDEATASANRDTALGNRVSSTEAKLNGGEDSWVAARIRDEATASANRDTALGNRVSSTEATARNVATTYTAVSRGNGAVAKFGRGAGIYNVDGTNFTGGGRGWRVNVFDSANTLIASNLYDTMAGDRSFSLGGAGDMAGFLNGISEGQAVIITTDDEPRDNRLTAGLVEAMERCGAGPLFSSPNFGYRGAYILVGQAGIGKGNGAEYYSGTGDTAPDAWLERRFDLLNGRPLLNGVGKAVAETNAAIKAEETARADAVSAVANRTSTLETSIGNGGNLLTNTDNSYDTTRWNYVQEAATGSARDGVTGSNWWPIGIHPLVMAQENGSTNRGGFWWQDVYGVEPGKTYQASMYTASHRCDTQVYIDCFNNVGGITGTFTSPYAAWGGNDGNAPLNNWARPFVNFVVPAGTSYVRFYQMKWGTYSGQVNSYAWFVRPQLVQVRPGVTSVVPYVPGTGDGAITAANSRISDEATASTNRDNAISGRVSTTEAKLNGDQDSTLAARIRDEATARANQDSAIAGRTDVLEVTAKGTTTSAATNDKFANWPNASGYPTGWITWNSGGNYRIERWAASMGSPYAMRTLNDTAEVESGFYQVVNVHSGKWVVEVTAQCVANSMSGAGVTLHGQYSLDFMSDPDTNGLTGDQGDRIRTWVKMFDLSQDFVNSINGGVNFHAMLDWTGFNRYRAPKYVQWYRMCLRPAGPGDIAGAKNASDITEANARIGREETARADAVSAVGRRADTLEANYSTVRSNLDNWNNDRYNDYVRVDARVGREETARADAVSAVANRTSVVEAQVSNDSNNLLRNGTFNAPGWVGRGAQGIPPYWNEWSNDGAGFRGASPRDSRYGAPAPLQMDRQGINVGITQPIYNLAPGWYAFEVDVTGEDGNWSGAGIHCNFNNGYAFNFGFATNTDTAGRTGDIGTANRQYTWLFYNGANTGNANLYIMSGWSGFQGGQDFGFWRGVYHRVVMRPATRGEILAQNVESSNLVARVSTTESAISGINGKVSAYWQVQAVAGNNRAQMTIHADANGGAGVDIVGDVAITGSDGNGRTVVNQYGVFTYYPNGNPCVKLGRW